MRKRGALEQRAGEAETTREPAILATLLGLLGKLIPKGGAGSGPNQICLYMFTRCNFERQEFCDGDVRTDEEVRRTREELTGEAKVKCLHDVAAHGRLKG